MAVRGFNHVSIRARDLERSVRFYEDVFGLERLPTYDFEALFLRVLDLDVLDDTFGDPLVELPDGSVQLYLRDPAGNLVEVNWPDVTTLDRSVVRPIVRHVDRVQQSEAASSASLYLDRPAVRSAT